MTTLSTISPREEALNDLPSYFFSLVADSMVTGKTEAERNLFATLVRALHKMKCTQVTVRVLCVSAGIHSIEELKHKRWQYSDYRELSRDITPNQALLLSKNVPSLRVPVQSQKITQSAKPQKIDLHELKDFLSACSADDFQQNTGATISRPPKIDRRKLKVFIAACYCTA